MVMLNLDVSPAVMETLIDIKYAHKLNRESEAVEKAILGYAEELQYPPVKQEFIDHIINLDKNDKVISFNGVKEFDEMIRGKNV